MKEVGKPWEQPLKNTVNTDLPPLRGPDSIRLSEVMLTVLRLQLIEASTDSTLGNDIHLQTP